MALLKTANFTINLDQVCNVQDYGDKLLIRQVNMDRFTITFPEEVATVRDWLEKNTIHVLYPAAPAGIPIAIPRPDPFPAKPSRKKAQG